MLRLRFAIALLLLLASSASGCGPPASDEPDLIMTGGIIYPLNGDDAPVQALAIRGADIVALGTDAEVRAMAGRRTQQMQLEGSVVLPGAFDAWIDLEALGRWDDSSLDLRLASSIEEVQAMVRNAAAARTADPGGWLVGWGWSENDWPGGALPTRDDLDDIGVERPIVLLRRGGRMAWLNGAALERLSPLPAADPTGGWIGRTDGDTPNGVLAGSALDLLAAILEPADARTRREWLGAGLRGAAAAGLTRVATAPVDADTVALLLELESRGLLATRVDLRLAPDALAAATSGRLASDLRDSRMVRIAAVGLRLDGPLSSRLAALSSPYEASGRSAPLLAGADALAEAAAAAHRAGLPLHLQASGDAAIAAGLDAIGPDPLPGTLLVGFDLPGEDAVTEAAARGIAVAIAPTRFTRDIYWLDRLLGPQRARRAHPWGDLVAAGLPPLLLASDAPAFPLRPLAGVAAALTRQDPDGYPAGGWVPEQALPQGLLLRSLVATAGPGAPLRVGGPADLTVWSEDPVAGGVQELLRGQALLTIVAGRVAYSRPLF